MQIFESRICPIDSFKEDRNINYYWFTVYDDVTNMWWHQTMFGYGCIQIHKDDCIPYFGPTYVSPAYRGKGIQRKLIEVRLDWCREKGYSEVCTKADEDNLFSIRNILACSFTETRRIDGEIFLGG